MVSHLNSQNIFNTTGDALLDGKSLLLKRPITSGGWARGIVFQNLNTTTQLASFGLLGTADVVNHLYMAHGASPWSSKLGLYVKANGYTGIGTTTPSQKLEVNNGNLLVKNGNLYMKGTANDAGDLIFQNGTSGQLARIWSNNDGNSGLFLSSGDNTSDITISSDGKIGIGTWTPSTKLEVKGDISNSTGSGGTLTLYGNNVTRRNRVILGADQDGAFLKSKWNTGGTDAISFRNSAGEKSMIIDKTDNVGIGTNNPDGWKLAVNGNIRAKEIKVETNWSDFVFYSNYNLPTLQEVEKHIKEKGHLKDIPSAKEVEEHGVFLGDMDSKLLQKIEELTLYTIQQDKALNASKKANKALEARLTKLEALIDTLVN